MKITCTLCPFGCRVTIEKAADGTYSVAGNTCKRGRDYAIQESTNPVRVVTSLVRVQGGTRSVCPCKTASPVPKSAIPDCLAELHALRVQAPIRTGDILHDNLAGTGIALIATSAIWERRVWERRAPARRL